MKLIGDIFEYLLLALTVPIVIGCILRPLCEFIKDSIDEAKRVNKREKEERERQRILENDPIYRLQQKYKKYSYSPIVYENSNWLDSNCEKSKIRINTLRVYEQNDLPGTDDLEFFVYDDKIEDPLFKEFEKAQNSQGMELRQCRECGEFFWAYTRLEHDAEGFAWDGFHSSRCRFKCYQRGLEHYSRIYGKNWHRIDTDYRYYKNNKELPVHEDFDTIPMYEYAKKQNFKCAICGGKMYHEWVNSMSNYLYHSIDHIIPVSKGGKHKSGNIQIVHLLCNMVKWTGDNIKLSIDAYSFLKKNVEKTNDEELLINEYRKYRIN